MDFELRVGQGIDIHAFEDNGRVILGNVVVSEERGLKGHSDADVVIHALVDALLGAVGLGDIGQWFPDTDPVYRGADSAIFLEQVVSRVAADGWSVQNADITVLAQWPRISPFTSIIKQRLSELLGIDSTLISLKATTTEGLGFVGRVEGIYASAVVLLCRGKSTSK